MTLHRSDVRRAAGFVDDESYGIVATSTLRPPRSRPRTSSCQRASTCEMCGAWCEGLVALIVHTTNHCPPKGQPT